MEFTKKLTNLQSKLAGELVFDDLSKAIYATDASIYFEEPKAVAYPKNDEDIQLLIQFAAENHTTLIPRTAGTSLAGQCVGNGIVVDVSKHFTSILEFNADEKWVIVQPGVIRDELNLFLKSHGLFFGPETSTSNRAMLGGMVGNNSTGSNSIKFGNTRDHVLSIDCILSDGSKVNFSEIDQETLTLKCKQKNLEGDLYRYLHSILLNEELKHEAKENFPKESIHRRNTGYALDEILFNPKLNLSKLICGSEGTLAFITAIKLNLLPLPPKESVLLCPHFKSIPAALKAVQLLMKFEPFSCELMDKTIMDCTKDQAMYSQYRFFLDGDPEAVLLVELRAEDKASLAEQIHQIITKLTEQNLGYSFPKIYPPHTTKVWQLRKAGLGLLANISGDDKAIAVIEDTAVCIDDLPNYIEDFTAMMQKHQQRSVYYAHAGAGELHLRPILNLKKSEGIESMKAIAWDTAKLVKKYKGSLSGEHGDGRVRASFLQFMIGEKLYAEVKKIKQLFDPNAVFNYGKIIDAPPIDKDLRYRADRKEPKITTFLSFEKQGGILRLAEKCNGSGDCRKTHLSGGTMCPSYMATKNEKDTTRARANALRTFLTASQTDRERWTNPAIKEALDLCLSCKACKSECPSNVDVALMKAEFSYQHQEINGYSLRAKLFAHISFANQLGSYFSFITNRILKLNWVKQILGIAKERDLPKIENKSLRNWLEKRKSKNKNGKTVFFFIDEFSNYNDVAIGKKAVLLLEKMGYQVKIAPIKSSGRSFLSKGFLKEAKVVIQENYQNLADIINQNQVLVGIEPSAILTFRDEFLNIAKGDSTKKQCIADHAFTMEEFLIQAYNKKEFSAELFTKEAKQVMLHTHCYQKALSNPQFTIDVLSIPQNYHVQHLATGCCGMAGSFGYEKEHYNTSMQVGELVLFPALRKVKDEIICAVGTSCRHQIKDGVNKKALHPVEVLYDALEL